MKYGDIYYVDFSTSIGHEYQGKRPALVIQSDDQLKMTNMVTVMPLTSKIAKKFTDDILVTKDGNNNLMNDSILRVHHINSFDHSRFIKKIGMVDTIMTDKVKTYLVKHFGM